ncbi:MAG: DUF488 family protein [Saprospiraceae bacterium]|nr:DUF488 family protein [Candidatus Brachybacter algidus]
MINIRSKRIYEEPVAGDGYRILVDRLWPRGVSKEAAALDEWDKIIAPSANLRKWFDHKAERFDEFTKLYEEELELNKDELQRIRNIAKDKIVTLLYAAKNPKVNHVIILQRVLTRKP